MYSTTTLVFYTGSGPVVAYTVPDFPYYNGPTLNEFMLVSCVFLAISALSLWRFIMPKQKEEI